MVAHIFNPSILQAEAGGSMRVWRQPCLQSKFQKSYSFYTKEPHLKEKKKKGKVSK